MERDSKMADERTSLVGAERTSHADVRTSHADFEDNDKHQSKAMESGVEIEPADTKEGQMAEEPEFASPTLSEKATQNADTAPAPWKPAIFTTYPLFMGYAGMIVLQAHIKNRLGIPKGHNSRADVFGTGVSFLYLGNLIFRLMHNVVFTCLRPRQRVLLSYFLMTLAHTTLAVMYYMVKSDSVAWVFVAYMCSGVAIGSFESNLISCLTPLGHATKMWSVLGIPVGFNTVSIGSFIAFAISPEDINLQMGVYLFIAASNLAGLLFMAFVVPNIPFEATNDTVLVFIKDLKKWREWIPIVWKHCASLCVDMFAVSVFSSLSLYLYDEKDVPLWPYSETTMPKNAFLAWYFCFSFLGDFTSRRIAYHDKARIPFLFLIGTLLGTVMILSKVALAAPFGMFLVMFANGSIYAQTTKYVDNCVPKKYNLVALSLWLFLGDIGSFVGAQIVQPVQGWLGTVPTHNSTQPYYS